MTRRRRRTILSAARVTSQVRGTVALEEAEARIRPEAVVPTASSSTTTLTTGRAHVVLPAYNEEGSLPPLLRRLADLSLTGGLTVWVVDDGSSDATAALVEAGVAGLDLRLVRHVVNLGLGRAVQSGLRAALEQAEQDDVV